MDELNNDWVMIGTFIALAFTLASGIAFGWRTMKAINKK
jgi:predicted negative regulator of RcsB-dependent stress response